MKKIKINGHKLEVYNDISELPVERFHQHSRYSLIASGIGDTIQDIDKHIEAINSLMAIDAAKAQQELLNLRQNLILVLQGRDFRHKAFLFLVKSIDGKPWEDYSDDGIEEMYNLLNGESVAAFKGALSDVICEIDDQMQRYFPEMFDDSKDKNLCDLVRKRAMLQIDVIRNGADHKKEIDELSTKIWEKYEPKSFENDKAIVDFDRQFENMCLILSKEFQGGVKGYTVMEFYSAYNLLQEREKEFKKLNRKKK